MEEFTFMQILNISLIIGGGLWIIYLIYCYFYFKGKKFNSIKNNIKKYVDDCNELNDHIEELKKTYLNISSSYYGESNLSDMSNYNFKRKEWDKFKRHHKIHHCSLNVCKNSYVQPYKYLCKYFNIKSNEDSLIEFETLLNNFSSVENGKLLLEIEKDRILESIKDKIPFIINLLSPKNISKEIGFYDIDINDYYFPTYTFQYVSAGGNSSTKNDIKLDLITLEDFIQYLSEGVKFNRSVIGQRRLMTRNLRESIKQRDNYTCQCCGLSTFNERNLLLEIDHIKPISKGGITEESNLQTLCWKCNRSKGSKEI
jgi:hypothetical protein